MNENTNIKEPKRDYSPEELRAMVRNTDFTDQLFVSGIFTMWLAYDKVKNANKQA